MADDRLARSSRRRRGSGLFGKARDLFFDDRFGELRDDFPDDALDDIAREREDGVRLSRRETELTELAGEVSGRFTDAGIQVLIERQLTAL